MLAGISLLTSLLINPRFIPIDLEVDRNNLLIRYMYKMYSYNFNSESSSESVFNFSHIYYTYILCIDTPG